MAGNPNQKLALANAGLTAYHTNGMLDWTGTVRCLPERLSIPLRWKQPKRIFVNSLSDLFHPDVPDAFIVEVFAVMAAAERHTFQVLTKRPERMARLVADPAFEVDVGHAVRQHAEDGWAVDTRIPARGGLQAPMDWPRPNIWLGTSVENQATADARIPQLLATPAAVRFLSCEPLLGPIDLRPWLGSAPPVPGGSTFVADDGIERYDLFGQAVDGIDWVIAGGESGSQARPWHPDWARQLRDQCAAADVPFFWKQHGAWSPAEPTYEQMDRASYRAALMHRDGRYFVLGETNVLPKWMQERVGCGADPDVYMYRVGTKASGSLLDGRVFEQFPEART